MFNLFNRQKNDSNGDYDYWRKEAEKARSLARSYENGMISTPAMRNRDDAHYGNLTKRVIEVMRLNRALRRRNYTVRRQREQLNELRQAAIELRLAQRNYMQAKADPGHGRRGR